MGFAFLFNANALFRGSEVDQVKGFGSKVFRAYEFSGLGLRAKTLLSLSVVTHGGPK